MRPADSPVSSRSSPLSQFDGFYGCLLLPCTLRKFQEARAHGIAKLFDEINLVAFDGIYQREVRLLDHAVNPRAAIRALDRILAHAHPAVFVNNSTALLVSSLLLRGISWFYCEFTRLHDLLFAVRSANPDIQRSPTTSMSVGGRLPRRSRVVPVVIRPKRDVDAGNFSS